MLLKRIFIILLLDHIKACTQIGEQICQDGDPITLQKNNYPNVIGRWGFDNSQINFDSSRLQNNIINPPSQLAPGFGQHGNSVQFDGVNYSQIPHIQDYNLRVMTISFWVFPLTSTEQFTTLLRKAQIDTDYTPTITIWPFNDDAQVGGGQIEIIVTTSSGKEGLKSRGLIVGRRWSNIILILQHNILLFYLNGVLDNQVTMTSLPILNEGPFYIGGDPWNAPSLIYFDDLIFFDQALLQNDIKKISRQPGQLNQRLLYLGCEACSYHLAMNSCKQTWHLCSIQEIHSGVYQYARSQGWLRQAMDIWTRLDEMDQQLIKNYLDPKINKAGICCYDSFI